MSPFGAKDLKQLTAGMGSKPTLAAYCANVSNADKAVVQQLPIGVISGEVFKYLKGFYLAIQKDYALSPKPSSCSDSTVQDDGDMRR